MDRGMVLNLQLGNIDLYIPYLRGYSPSGLLEHHDDADEDVTQTRSSSQMTDDLST